MKVTMFIAGALAALVAATPAPAPEAAAVETSELVSRAVEANLLSKRDCGKCSNHKKLCWNCNPTGGCATNIYKC